MIDQLFDDLRRLGIRIWVEGDRLKYEAPRGALTEDLLARLRLQKQAILDRFSVVNDLKSASIPKANRSGTLPLSFPQQRMWFLWKLAPESPAYCIPVSIKLTGRVNLKALIGSLCAIQRRHEVLRTHFVEALGNVSQVIDENAKLDVLVIDLTVGCAQEAEETARQRMLEDVARPFDLSRNPPFEVRLYRLAETVHCLFIKLHHIAVDGLSYSIFLREFAALYESLDRGGECVLKDLPIQYADFAVWQRQRFQGTLRSELLSYWKQQLGDGLTPLSLPTDRPRPPIKSMRGDTVSFQLPASLFAQLSELGRAQHATMFMTLMSAFRILLYRYSGQTDFLIGTPTLWRNHPDTGSLIGYFANTMVLRNALRPTDTYLDVLARERKTALDSYQHQEIPFDTVVEEMAPERTLSDSPLFQVIFVFGERSQDVLELPDLRVEFSELATSTAKFDLGLWVQETETGLRGDIEYASDLFERETIERMATHFEILLADITRRPQVEIANLHLLSVQEQNTLLREWNDTARPIAKNECLHELFEAAAAARPQAIAVYHGEQRILYAELNGLANRLAHRLLESGIKPEQLVGVCAKRSPHLVAALLAVLKAGAAYVPIDPSYPAERIKLILNDSGVNVILTDRDLAETMRELPADLILLNDDHAADPGHAELYNPVGGARPENLAYVLYTSGSTGRPKGVMIEHRSAVALLHWAYGVYGPQELAGVLAATSVCFDLSVFELFVPLCAGHSVILAENALELFALPARNAITLINTVPSVMHVLLQAPPDAFPGALRVINLAGERLETRLVDAVYRKTRALKVYDLYGPTETTTYSLFKLRLPQQPPSIGRPISNTRAYVLDENGMPVPIGVVGELCLAGEGLARGYLNRSDLTAERFVAPRSRMIPDDRLYRTGDLVRYASAGEIEYQGRNDDQVKLRGFRIEPGEVKAALLMMEDVKDAVVIARRSRDDEIQLIAYVVIDAARFSASRVKLHLRKLLPEYMIPALFVPIESFPLNPNGKVDFGRLEEMKAQEQAVGADFPATETERQVFEIWCEALNAEHIGVHDNFFELGGHSLTAMHVTARINDAFGIDVPLGAIFQHPTIYELAAEIEILPRGLRAAGLPALHAHAHTQAPAALLQQHIWLIHHLATDPSFLNITSSVSLLGLLDLSAAKQALHTLVERHPILRTKFFLRGARLWQDSSYGALIDVPVRNLSKADDEVGQLGALASIYTEATRPFDIGQGPCARFLIVRRSETEHLLIMVLHHIIIDEWSLGVLGREFALCYAAFMHGLPCPLAATAFTFADYAIWEQQCLEGRMFNQQLALWKERLKPPLPRLQLPWRGDIPGSLESYPVHFDSVLAGKLATLARRERSSLFVVLLSALKRLLQRQSGTSDIRVCTNVANRYQRGLENMIGPLTDTLILRTVIPAEHTPVSALRMVRNTFVAAYGHQNIPFEEMAARVTSELNIERADLAQVFFLFREEEPPKPPFPGLAVEDATVFGERDFFKSALHNYDLILYLYKVADHIRGQLTLRERPQQAAAGGAVLSMYKMLLEELVGEDACLRSPDTVRQENDPHAV